ncbi:hypothetical protein GQX74_002258 [Glossina fuscipes]|nr:hypothetical protein GQX74_002258 [Glossina fuscipes]
MENIIYSRKLLNFLKCIRKTLILLEICLKNLPPSLHCRSFRNEAIPCLCSCITRIFCINLVKVLQLICLSITSTTTAIKTTVLLEGLTILISVLMADILKKFISTAFSGYAVADVRLMATNLEL